MEYRRFSPSAELTELVESYWLVIAPAHPVPVRAVLVPNGRPTLQFCLAEPGVRIDAAGTRSLNADVLLPPAWEPYLLEQSGRSHYVGVQLRPWGARHLWPGAGTTPIQVAEAAESLPDRQKLTADPARELDRWLTAIKPTQTPEVDVLRHAIRIIDAAPGLVRVGELPARVDCSASTLYRYFVANTGLTPKQYLSTMRHRSFIDTLFRDVAGDPVALLAALAGYSDQSHASRDFRRHTGMTVRQFRGHYDGIARLMAEPVSEHPDGV